MGAEDNDYTVSNALYHMVKYMRLRTWRYIILEGGENLGPIHPWFIIHHIFSTISFSFFGGVSSTKKLGIGLPLMTTTETMDFVLFLCLYPPLPDNFICFHFSIVLALSHCICFQNTSNAVLWSGWDMNKYFTQYNRWSGLIQIL